jgi:hypothetical protein
MGSGRAFELCRPRAKVTGHASVPGRNSERHPEDALSMGLLSIFPIGF